MRVQARLLSIIAAAAAIIVIACRATLRHAPPPFTLPWIDNHAAANPVCFIFAIIAIINRHYYYSPFFTPRLSRHYYLSLLRHAPQQICDTAQAASWPYTQRARYARELCAARRHVYAMLRTMMRCVACSAHAPIRHSVAPRRYYLRCCRRVRLIIYMSYALRKSKALLPARRSLSAR